MIELELSFVYQLIAASVSEGRSNVVEFMIVGASAIQIGTLNFIDPTASGKMVSDLENYCIENNIQKISDLTGSFILQN